MWRPSAGVSRVSSGAAVDDLFWSVMAPRADRVEAGVDSSAPYVQPRRASRSAPTIVQRWLQDVSRARRR